MRKKKSGRRKVSFGSLRRVRPISAAWGLDRGRPVDRYYIERFLQASSAAIQGRVLEVGENRYTRLFGRGNVAGDVLHVAQGRPGTSIVADLTRADDIASDSFDCIICTQTLQYIYEVDAATETLHRILKPGGIALVTFPGISQISRYDMDQWGEYWRFTTASARRLFERYFSSENVTVESHGNVLAATCFLYGLSADELSRQELDYRDPRYELLVTVAARKPVKMPGSRPVK